mmetsp:Transcript_15831/g.25854  ORF Transcript_15831/g.25854 Transcript_15831/m.25854 type:complete len:83 (-) Transcript_15831:4-252(-)
MLRVICVDKSKQNLYVILSVECISCTVRLVVPQELCKQFKKVTMQRDVESVGLRETQTRNLYNNIKLGKTQQCQIHSSGCFV